MTKINVEQEKEDGWTRWVSPIMTKYRMACCDCGLVHDIEFKIVKVVMKNKDGSFEYEDINSSKFRIIFRGKRNNRSTGQVRRWQHNTTF